MGGGRPSELRSTPSSYRRKEGARPQLGLFMKKVGLQTTRGIRASALTAAGAVIRPTRSLRKLLRVGLRAALRHPERCVEEGLTASAVGVAGRGCIGRQTGRQRNNGIEINIHIIYVIIVRSAHIFV